MTIVYQIRGRREQTGDRRQYAVGRRREKVKRSKLKVMKIEKLKG